VFRRAGIDVGGRWLSANVRVTRFFHKPSTLCLLRVLLGVCRWQRAYRQDHRSHAHLRRRVLTDMATFPDTESREDESEVPAGSVKQFYRGHHVSGSSPTASLDAISNAPFDHLFKPNTLSIAGSHSLHHIVPVRVASGASPEWPVPIFKNESGRVYHS
jgi:hypothetical protein